MKEGLTLREAGNYTDMAKAEYPLAFISNHYILVLSFASLVKGQKQKKKPSNECNYTTNRAKNHH